MQPPMCKSVGMTADKASVKAATVETRRVSTPVERLLAEWHAGYQTLRDGEVASYIPELSNADPEWFGISIVTLDGHEYTVGDSAVPFTIQSISKPFVYGLALEDNGEEYVLDKVGLEPSGDAFNAISLDPTSGRPSNPMINAGAIATAALVKANGSDALARVLEMFGRYAARQVAVDVAVYQSESETGYRNRAIGHLLRNFEIVTGDPERALDIYFRQCSISMTCRDLAVMGACLANGGVNPVSGERAVDAKYVGSILSVMASCGMYDYAGEWIYRVGMPAKSGVSGGVVAVLPGQLGIGVFSPPLDSRGNSVRGVQVCASVSRSYSLHMLSVPDLARSTVRVSHNGETVRSRRRRQPAAQQALSAAGGRIRSYELQGDMVFASVDAFSRRVAADAAVFDVVTIDFKHVGRIGRGALEMITDLVWSLLEVGKLVAVSHAGHLQELEGRVGAMAAKGCALAVFADKDAALEWAEDRLLERIESGLEEESVPAADNEFCRGLSAGAVEALEAAARQVRFGAGETIVRAGEEGESVYLLVRGRVSVTVDLPGGGLVRVAALSAGMAFGEMAILGEKLRSANVIADTDVECLEVEISDLDRLGESDSSLPATMFRNLAAQLAGNLRKANSEIRALSG